jgi:hypothetical protein
VLGVVTFRFEAMRLASKIVGLFLIAALAVTSFAPVASASVDRQPVSSALLSDAGHSDAAPSDATPSEPAAACHEHQGMPIPPHSPSHSRMPAPTSYQCCLTGHDAAMVRPHQLAQPSTAVLRKAAYIGPATAVSKLDGSEVSEAPIADPPNITPLRI